MLQELVRQRLIAAADEIFELFEKTIASYEKQLGQAWQENERQRQKLEAGCETQIFLHVEDVEPWNAHQEKKSAQPNVSVSSLEQPLPFLLKEEEKETADVEPWTAHQEKKSAQPSESVSILEQPHPFLLKKEEKETADVKPWTAHLEKNSAQPNEAIPSLEQPHPLSLKKEEEETDVSKLPLPVISVKSEDKNKPPESSPLQHHSPRENPYEGPTPDSLLAPLLDNDIEIHPDSNMESNSYDKRLKCGKERSNSGQKKPSKMRKRFSCVLCGARFTKKQHMIRHTRTHTGEKPFRCSVCGKMFSRKEHVDQHMTVHTREKPVGCSLCGKRFSNKSYMKTHMRTHTGEKPFSCSFCGERFSHRSSWTTHMRGHNIESERVRRRRVYQST